MTGTQSVTVASMQQATIFSKGNTLSWLTNLCDQPTLRCTVRLSRLTSTSLSVTVPRWTCLFPLRLRLHARCYISREGSQDKGRQAREMACWRRILPARTQVLGHADGSTQNVTKARANRFGSMKTYWSWHYCGRWTTTCLAGRCSTWQWHIWKLKKCPQIFKLAIC